MERKRYLTAVVGIIVLFAVGLELFFIFSAPYGDGLEKTLERAHVEEPEPVYKAPLDYGDNYAEAFVSGLIGFAAVFAIGYGTAKILGRRNAAGAG